jgi:4-hydroxy-2-oxoheptanedioate aldolase
MNANAKEEVRAMSQSLKQRIHAGELVIGVSAPMTATRSQLEDILGKDDYGFVSIDSQHGPLNEERLVEFCAIAEALGIHTQLRIKHTRHTYLAGNYADLGPTGLEVPQVEEEATVVEAVENFYYPPLGKRSWGGAARWGVKNHPDRLEYAA